MAKERKLTLEPCRTTPATTSDSSSESNHNSTTTSTSDSATTTTAIASGHSSIDGPILSQVSPFVVGYLGITPCSVQGVVRIKYPTDKPVKARRLTVTLTGIARTKWTTRTVESTDNIAGNGDRNAGKVIREHGGIRGSLEAKLSGVSKSDGKGGNNNGSGGHSGKLSSSATHSQSTSSGNANGEMVEIIHTHQAEDVILSLSQDLWRTTAGDSWGALGGEHTFPFYFSLPSDLPDSMEAEYGSVRYMLSAVLERRGRMLNTAGRKVVDVPLTIHRATLSTLHELVRPRKWQSDPAWSVSSGIAYEMSIPRASFGPGDTLEALVKLKLASPGNVRFVGASLGIKEYITYRANNITRTESTYVANVDIDDQGHVKSSTGNARPSNAKEANKKSKSSDPVDDTTSRPAGQTDRVNKDGTREIQRTIIMQREHNIRPSVTTRLISIRHKLKLKLKLAGEKEIAVDCPSWLTGVTRAESQQLEDWLRNKADTTAMALRQYTDEIDPPKDGRNRQRDRYRASNSYHLLPGVARHATYLQLIDGIAGLPVHMTTKDASIALAVAARTASAQTSNDNNGDLHAYVHYSRPGAPQSGVPQYDVYQKNRRSLAFGESEGGHQNYLPNGAAGQRRASSNSNSNEHDDPARRYSMPVFPNDPANARAMGASPPMGYYGPNPYYQPYNPYGAPPPPLSPGATPAAGPPHMYYPYGHMPSPGGGAPYGYNTAAPNQMPEPGPVASKSSTQASTTTVKSKTSTTSSSSSATTKDSTQEAASTSKGAEASSISSNDQTTDKNEWRDIHDRPKSKALMSMSSNSTELKDNQRASTNEQPDSDDSEWEDEDKDKDPLASVRARQLRNSDKELPNLPRKPIIHDLKPV
ncbi:hypothetical protein BDF22DRAFT_668858 [Syncephalis plumigaleata]|nr:hypothetical protein BDF22DRAFT_668858 [Syncephalis plumigaleata]